LEKIRVAVCGGFHPLHVGHLRHFREAKLLTPKTRLIVFVNSDEDIISKYGFCAMPLAERMELVGGLRCVDEVVAVVDRDSTVAKTIRKVRPDIFAKGGDRTLDTLPKSEIKACKDVGCTIVTGVGKKVSSSFEFILDTRRAGEVKHNPSRRES